MTVTVTKKLYVLDDDHLRNLGVANIGDAGYDASDRNRLYMHYDSKAGKISLNPETNLYGRANLLGGNYTFDPSGDYLNAGWPGEGGSMPIRNTGSGLDNPNMNASGPGGSTFGSDDLRIGLPRMSPNTGGFDPTQSQCPLGFYLYNNVCVPGAMYDPTNANNILGINTGSGSFQKAKGVILRVIPPVKTQKGALFQIVTQIQNIGHQPGKFFIKASVPSIGISESTSNSIFVEGGQQGVVYATLQMPSSVPANSLMTVQSDLYQTLVGTPDATPQHEDSNQAQLPNPDTVLGMPPVRPPIPQFPVSTVPNNTGSYGYPYNAPRPPPNYPLPPPPPPPFRGFAGFLDYDQYQQQYPGYYQNGQAYPPGPYQDPYGQYQQQSQPYIDPYTQQPQYGYPPMQPYYQDPYSQQQYGYPPIQQSYSDPYAQQYQDPSMMYANQLSSYGAATPSPYPIYPNSPASAPYQFPQPQPQYIPLPPLPQQQQQPLINIDTNGLTGEGGSIDFNTGTVVGGGSGGLSGGTISGLQFNNNTSNLNNGQDLGNTIRNNVNDNIQQAFDKAGINDNRHDSNNKHHKKSKRHTSSSNFALNDSPFSDDRVFTVGTEINIMPKGFLPGEPVLVQLYSADYLFGTHKLKQLLGEVTVNASGGGELSPLTLKVPKIKGKYLAIIAIGRQSEKKVHSLFIIQ